MKKKYFKTVGCIFCMIMLLVIVGCSKSETPTEEPQGTEAPSAENSEEIDSFDSAKVFYEGKDVTVVCPQKGGGVNDTLARLLATNLKDLLGARSVQVQNMDGGSGIVAYNWMTTTAPKDGTVIAVGSQPATNAIINADPACKFGALDFNYLGIVDEDAFCITAKIDGPTSNIEKVLKKDEIKIGSTAVTGSHTYYAVTFLEAAQFDKPMLVPGYGSVNEGALAMTKGELDLNASGVNTALKGELEQIIIQFAKERDPRILDVPTMYEVFPDMNDETKMLLEMLPRNIKVITVNKEVPQDRVVFLEECIQQVFADPKFKEDMKMQTGLDFSGGINAEEATAIAENYEKNKDKFVMWKDIIDKYVQQ